MGTKMNALVTGGGGFVGTSLVKELVKRGIKTSSFSRNHYVHLELLGVEQFKGDLRNAESVFKATKSIDVVFHVAAMVGLWGKYSEFYDVNVKGTENLIKACKQNGVKYLVFTSSASVVFGGKDIIKGDETLPYPSRAESAYSGTKALAEKLVLKASGPNFISISLRPHVVWGPGDQHIIPGILDRARKKRLWQIGPDSHFVDTTYIDNFTQAQIIALDALKNGKTAGQVYFITNGEPVKIWGFINKLLKIHGHDPVNKKISRGLALMLAGVSENINRLLFPDKEPSLTRFAVKELCSSHYFDISKAQKELGYRPKISTEEGLKILENMFDRGHDHQGS